MVVFTFSVIDQKYYFFGNFGLKNQNCQFKLKFGTYNPSLNILELSNALVLEIRKYLKNLEKFKKSKIWVDT